MASSGPAAFSTPCTELASLPVPHRQPAMIPRLLTLAAETELPPNVIQGGCRRVISCAQELHPEQGRWFPFVSCIEKHPGAGPRRGRKCAKGAHLNTTAIAECAAGECVHPGGSWPPG